MMDANMNDVMMSQDRTITKYFPRLSGQIPTNRNGALAAVEEESKGPATRGTFQGHS